jgi:colicin import membrane protein
MAIETEAKEAETTKTADDAVAAKIKDAEDKAAKYKAELSDIKAAQSKREADEKAKAKADADAKAIGDGEAKRILAERETELAAERKARTDLETAHRERVDRMIAKLPEATRTKLEAIKTDLPLVKLEALVELEADQAAKVIAPPPRAPGGAAEKNGNVKLSGEARDKLDELNVGGVHIGAMNVVHDKILGNTKFVLPIKAMIDKLQAMSRGAPKLSAEEYAKRHG